MLLIVLEINNKYTVMRRISEMRRKDMRPEYEVL